MRQELPLLGELAVEFGEAQEIANGEGVADDAGRKAEIAAARARCGGAGRGDRDTARLEAGGEGFGRDLEIADDERLDEFEAALDDDEGPVHLAKDEVVAIDQHRLDLGVRGQYDLFALLGRNLEDDGGRIIGIDLLDGELPRDGFRHPVAIAGRRRRLRGRLRRGC